MIPVASIIHGFTASYEDIKRWCLEDGHLDTHNGDVDYLTLALGGYNSFMPVKKT